MSIKFCFGCLLELVTEETVGDPSFFPFVLSFALLQAPMVVWPPEKTTEQGVGKHW